MIQRLEQPDECTYHRPDQPVGTDSYLRTTPEDSRPGRSLRRKRQILTVAITSFVVGSLLILFNSPFRNEFLAPGPLSSNHAQLLSGQGADRCAACHGAANTNLAGWITDAFTGGRHQPVNQSELCMKCHSQTLVEEFALNPHNADPHLLADKTNRVIPVSHFAQPLGRQLVGGPSTGHSDIACRDCHREHHGDQNLSVLTDQQCQTCHGQQFHSFELDHPEFRKWPLVERSSIAFDHSSHALKHFPERAASFDCQQCHIADRYQNVMTLAPYSQSCAQCHDQQIAESVDSGIQLVALPMLDLDVIRKSGLNVGEWPSGSSGDFDGDIPAIMRLLLQADPMAQKVFERIGYDFNFSDVDPTDPAQVADACELAWSIKSLLFDLAQGGKSSLIERVETALGHSLSDLHAESITQGIDQSGFRSAIRQWLPNLATELAQAHPNRHQSGLATWMPKDAPILSRYQDDDELLAPNPLEDLMRYEMQENPHVSAQATSKLNRQDPQNDPGRVINRSTDQPIHEHELLAVNPLQQINPVAPQNSSAPKPSAATDDPSQTSEASKPAFKSSPPLGNQSQSHIQVPLSAKATRWIRNDVLFRISYQPVGHADPYLKTWLEIATSTPSVHEPKALFDALNSTTAVGNCRKCHTVDSISDSQLAINWTPKYRDPAIRSFTNFSHGPHLIHPQLRDCSECHQLDEAATNAASFNHFDATEAISNFLPIRKLNCVTCHAQGKASNSCTHCHSYHVGSRISGTD